MTDVVVSWVNATRVGQQRKQIEEAYLARLMDFCETPEMAMQLHNEHYAKHQRLDSAWGKFNAIATEEATRGLLPSERKLAAFQVKFVR